MVTCADCWDAYSSGVSILVRVLGGLSVAPRVSERIGRRRFHPLFHGLAAIPPRVYSVSERLGEKSEGVMATKDPPISASWLGWLGVARFAVCAQNIMVRCTKITQSKWYNLPIHRSAANPRSGYDRPAHPEAQALRVTLAEDSQR